MATINKPLKLALCMIAKDKADIIQRALDSTLVDNKPIFDLYCLADTGSTDGTPDEFASWCKKYNAESKIDIGFLGTDYKTVYPHNNPVLGDFGKARNNSFNLAKKAKADFAMWIDTDDVIEGAENIRKLIEFMNKEKFAAALLTYDYAGDKNIKIVTQKRERIIDIRLKGTWRDRVHETYDIQEPNAKLIQVDDVKIVHLRTNSEALETGRRNHLIMLDQLEEEGIDNFSNKMLNNIAFDHWEYGEWEEAIKYYETLLSRPDINNFGVELVYQILMKVARAYLGLSLRQKAIAYGLQAIEMVPSVADAYLLMAEIFSVSQNWDEVLHYADKVLALGKPNTTSPINEADYTVTPLEMKRAAYESKGNIKAAIECLNALENVIPNHPQIKFERRRLEKEIKKNEATIALANLTKWYQSTNTMGYLDRVLDAIPIDLRSDETIRKLIAEIKYDYKRKRNVVKLKGTKIIHIYAGGHFEQWDGNSDVLKGIGGSEGMCIQMARELAKLGNDVTVWNECRETAGTVIDGVLYEDWRKWNQDIECDVFISLRIPQIFKQMVKAKKTYLWLHDTGYGDQDITNFYSPNKVIVLSEYHKDIIKQNHGVEDDSIFWISRNALNPYALEKAQQWIGKATIISKEPKTGKEKSRRELLDPRNPYKIIYASSYDRGLINALSSWNRIKQEVPEAELHIFYGWNTYDAIMNAREGNYRKYMEQQKAQLLQLMTQYGVYDHGRVSQDELYKEFATSSIWFYPTEFTEISCITAMQAQALGAIPVCTPEAALKETVNSKYGFKVSLDKVSEAVIDLLKDQETLDKRRENMMDWARNAFSIESLALEWDAFFNNN